MTRILAMGLPPIPRIAGGAIFALFASACAEPGSGPTVELRIVHVDEVAGTASPQDVVSELATAQMGVVELVIRGIILIPDPCDDVHARVARDSAGVVVRIVARLSPGHAGRCNTVGEATLLHYDAVVRDLPAGADHLRVLHDYEGLPDSDPAALRWNDYVAFEGPIAVARGGR